MVRRDLVVVLAGGGLAAAGALALGDPGQREAALAVALGAALALARRAPRACWGLAALLLLIGGATGTLAGGDAMVAEVLLAAHAFAAGRFDPFLRGLAGAAVLGAAGLTLMSLSTDSPLVVVFAVVAGWGAGRALRDRSLAAAQLAARLEELQAEREAHAALSVRYERARIASELHDIVAHAISVMVVQASAGQRLASRDPAATAEAFEAIADAAHQAEREMGLLVGLLADEAPERGGGDLDRVGQLVARACGSGLDVRLTLEGDHEGLSPGAARAAYRLVQEGLTNALRYASGAPVTVRLADDGDALVVEVSNGAAPGEPSLADAGTGNGLRGLAERLDAVGGALEAGPLAGGGWLLRGRMPRAGAGARRGPARVACGGTTSRS